MQQAGVPDSVVRAALLAMNPERVLPFRFIAAVQYGPQFVPELDAAMLKCLDTETRRLPGTTVVLVDVSDSMNVSLSAKSEMTRMDAASGLALLARELSETVRILTFSDKLVEVPAFRGLALIPAIKQSQRNYSTQLGSAVHTLNANIPDYDRLIVITDEQSHDRVPGPKRNGYVINVASAKNGVGYGPWTHIDGWSERVLDYIFEAEPRSVS
jgi:hypothetical protein